MRFLLGWAIKLSFIGVIYYGVTGGFGEVRDTEEMFAKAFAEMQAKKLLPPP